jgi:hypothetical protein
MDGMANLTVEDKYRLILKREQGFAKTVALQIIEKPTLSVWMILIPIVFLHYFYNYRRFHAGMEGFAAEFIYTRKVALDAAYAVVERGMEKEHAISESDYQKDTGRSEKALKMHESQLGEIALLFDHYEKLLRAEGDTYEALVRHAYVNGSSFGSFLRKIGELEKETNAGMKDSLGEEELPGIMDRMESAVEEMRTEELKRIFS